MRAWAWARWASSNRGVISEIVPESSRLPGVRRVRRLHRHLPGGRADQRQLSLSDAAVGDGARRDDLHALRRRLPDHAGRARRQDHAREQSRLAAASTASSCASRAATRSISWSIRSGCNRRCCARARRSSRFPGPRRSRRSRQKFDDGRSRAAGSSASSDRTTPPTKKITSCRSSRGRAWGPRTSITIARAISATFFDALSGKNDALATAGDLYTAKAVLVVGADLAQQHPFLVVPGSGEFPASRRAHLCGDLRARFAKTTRRSPAFASRRAGNSRGVESLRDKLKAEGDLVIVFGDSIQGDGVRKLVAFGDSLGIPVKYVCLVDYSNSRGAFDMGLIPSGRRHERRADAGRERSGCSVGGRRESAEERGAGVAATRSSSCRICS